MTVGGMGFIPEHLLMMMRMVMISILLGLYRLRLRYVARYGYAVRLHHVMRYGYAAMVMLCSTVRFHCYGDAMLRGMATLCCTMLQCRYVAWCN